MTSFVSSSSKSTQGSQNLSDTASTHSTVSTATTLKGGESPKQKKKFFSLSKAEPQSIKGSYQAKQALHNEAIASYLAMR
ncbi:hypothetical protein N7533_012204 [Penicillium manginii]|jgi:hypothetical protein|uniref:uncharacterized protein n=1 Tax=Penicillium manginii TaxID=203109 RepID=UPI002547A206|nr:uncharacterized protein N7533_012204 [Penicillium manginii]KAJ5739420.1 hypothetical protein N7533_012204 [Penicillium manginii]